MVDNVPETVMIFQQLRGGMIVVYNIHQRPAPKLKIKRLLLEMSAKYLTTDFITTQSLILHLDSNCMQLSVWLYC